MRAIGSNPIRITYLKVTYKKDKAEMRLLDTFDLKEEAFKQWDSKFMAINNRNYSGINDKIQLVKAEWVKYQTANKNVPNHALYQILNKVTEKEDTNLDVTVLNYCEEYLKEIKKSNKIVNGTKINIKKAINHLSNFLKKEKKEKMLLKEFKYIDAKHFDTYMGSSDGAKNMATSTTGNIIKLKAMFNEAIKEELISKNPFVGIKLIYKSENKTPYIGIDDINVFIKNEYIKTNKELSFYRDIFVFALFTGLNYVDIKNMDKKYLLPVFKNRLKYDNFRSKTGKKIIQIIPNVAQKIMEKYSGMSSDSIFPFFWSQTFNDKLKIMSGIIGLNIELTSRIGRTSCNQMLIQVGGFDDNYKRAYMGWSNSSDISYVYTTIVDDILLRNTKNIEIYLENNIDIDYLNLI
jgi:integrase